MEIISNCTNLQALGIEEEEAADEAEIEIVNITNSNTPQPASSTPHPQVNNLQFNLAQTEIPSTSSTYIRRPHLSSVEMTIPNYPYEVPPPSRSINPARPIHTIGQQPHDSFPNHVIPNAYSTHTSAIPFTPMYPKLVENNVTDSHELKPPLSRHNVPTGPINGKLSLARSVRNLHFDGSVEGLAVDKFIYRFEQLANDYGIEECRYVEEIHSFLDGPALDFYWSCRSSKHYITWPQMRYAFMNRFQDYRTDNVIRLSLESRRQKHGEPFINFYNSILNMSSNLRNPVSQSDLIFLLTKNMNQSLQYELASEIPSSVAELVQKCVNIETTWKRLGSQPDYRPVHRKFVNEIQFHPTELYHAEQPDILNNPNEQTPPEISALVSRPSHKTNFELRCWNCYGRHRYHDCDVPIRDKFCFGCGRKGVLKPNCTNCSNKQGNSWKGVNAPGSSHFPPQTNRPRVETSESASNTDPEFYRLLKRPQPK